MIHRDDEMTPIERSIALGKGQQVDRMPIALIFASNMGSILGMSYREVFGSALNRAKCQMKAYEEFGYDGLSVTYNLHGFGMVLGAGMREPEDAPPSIESVPVKNIMDLSKLDLDMICLKHDKLAKLAFDSGQIILDHLGEELKVSGALPGPFTAAASIVGTEALLKATVRNPEQVHKLLKFSADAAIQLGREFMAGDLGVGLMDPLASGSVISRKKYNEFVLPYTKQIVTEWRKIKPDLFLDYHVCGNTTEILESMAETGIDSISLDNSVDLELAKEKVGDKISLCGNVNPIEVMYDGNAGDVEEAVRTCFRKAWDSPLGFTICTGCDLPMHTPLDNVYSYMRAARKYARKQALHREIE